ncbi:MAG: hypothetical protein K2G55_06695, partial [Lachnospiraceae bacterium]|nr:hypothetical protein [Lachnospiraceae bacterium]
TDGEGNTTTYEYGSNNQLAVMTDPAGEQETYHYDAQERLCRITDRNGTETRYSYNIYDNLTERRARKTDGAELADSYEYTPEGLLKSAISQGMRYSYAYDAVGRLTEKRASGRTLLSFRYDPNGNLTHQTDVTGKVTEYRYDLADNISEVWDNGKKVAEYEYNADETVKKLSCGSLYTEYAYDADRNLTGLKTLFGAEVITDNKYTYDGNGNRLEKLQKHGTIRYSYDSMNRLNKVQYPGATEELFYDKSGNRTKRLYNGAEELYQYDRRNRLTMYTKGGVSTQYEYDNAGNLLKDDKARYEYDAFNRNTKVETFSGNIQINRYDAEDLRHEMEENGKLVSFIFRGDEIVTEESQEDKIRYIRTSVLLASDAESARTYYHYASDEMSSITHVVDSEAGEILNHYEYDAWGNLTTCEEKVHNRFKFNGQQLDPVTQQYYLRARYYNPVIGRFTQEDTYRGDGLNLYAYCRNNPVYYVDSTGHFCEKMAETIKKLLDEGGICKEDLSKLRDYLVERMIDKEIKPWERDVALKLGINEEHVIIAGECRRRAIEINNMRGYWQRRNGTTAVMKAIDNQTGEEVYLVATNEPGIKQPKTVQGLLKSNEIYIGGEGHAEETIMNNKGERYTIIAGGTSRNICKDICQPLLETDGLTLGGSKYRGRKDKTPYRLFWR